MRINDVQKIFVLRNTNIFVIITINVRQCVCLYIKINLQKQQSLRHRTLNYSVCTEVLLYIINSLTITALKKFWVQNGGCAE